MVDEIDNNVADEDTVPTPEVSAETEAVEEAVPEPGDLDAPCPDSEAAAEPSPAPDAETAPEAAGPPYDPTAIRIETKTLTIDILAQRLVGGGIDLGPAAAGDPVWSEVARSRLVESLLLRVPLPAFYFDASTPERWLVVDGLQRLAALDTFINAAGFGLSGLEFFDHLQDQNFKDLPRHFQRRILETQVTGHLIQEGIPEPVRAAIIRRIKTG